MVSDSKFLDSTLWSHIVPQGWSPAWEPFVAIGVYFSLILLAKLWITIRKKPYQLALVLKIHNVFLAALSAVMFAGLGWSVIRSFMSSGFYGTFCHSDDENDKNIFWWMQIYYLSKWPEFLDTVFLVLRGRPLTFLHVWHHSSVAWVTWMANYDHLMFCWITGFMNTFVHVPMYIYYVIATKEKKPWWGRYLTSMQIVQFVIDIVTSLPWLYFYFNGTPCQGTLRMFLAGNFIGSSYMILFILFYRNTYKRGGGARGHNKKEEDKDD